MDDKKYAVIEDVGSRSLTMFCKHWIELDDDSGDYEFCRKFNKKTICCAGEGFECAEEEVK